MTPGHVLEPPAAMPSGGGWVVPIDPPPWSDDAPPPTSPGGRVVRASLVVAVRDRGPGIVGEVRALLGTLGPHDELVVVDDASGDATVAALGDVEDARLRLVRLVAPRGPVWATNLGIRRARGRLLGLLTTPASRCDVAALLHEVLATGRLVGIQVAPTDGWIEDAAVVGWRAALIGRVGFLDPASTEPFRDVVTRIRAVVVPAMRVEVGSPEHEPEAVVVDEGVSATRPPVAAAPPSRFPPRRGPVAATMASVQRREHLLEDVVRRILPQVDGLFVYLNDHDEVPAVLDHPRIRVARGRDHGDLRDNGKFFFDAHLPDGYHLTIDDDLAYPPDYVDHLVAKVEQFDRRAVIGVHGSTLRQPESSYFDPQAREIRHFKTALDDDEVVDVLGTGTTAMHTSTLRMTAADLPSTGMADIWVAVAAHRAGIPMVAVSRPEGWVTPLPDDGPTLFGEFMHDDTAHIAALSTVRLERPDPWAATGRRG